MTTSGYSAERVIPRRAVASWMLYDLANVIFSMGVISSYFPLYVRAHVGESHADSQYSIITGVAMGIMFLISPLLGAMTDRARRRMPFLVWATIIACGCTAFIARGPFLFSAILFVIANGGYQAGVQFYDALLPEVTTEENRGRIGGAAIGLGYLGSYIALGIGIVHGTDDKVFLFSMIAALFFLLALPCFFFVKERGNPTPRPIFNLRVIGESTRQTIQTLREGKRYPGLLRFLVGRAFYTDAINTVIAYMALYTVNAAVATGLTQQAGERRAQFVLLTAITAAIPGGVIWGQVVDWIGPKRTLTIVLSGWILVFMLAALIGAARLPISFLYVVACGAGIALGGTWAADRPLMLRLTPPDRVGEFYGLYGMVGRFSAVTGPGLWGIITWVSVQHLGLPVLTGEALAIISLLAMIAVSIKVLGPVDDGERNWQVVGSI
jgi:MFS transporter, UMF1 family